MAAYIFPVVYITANRAEIEESYPKRSMKQELNVQECDATKV
jgi:hypothetical protein